MIPFGPRGGGVPPTNTANTDAELDALMAAAVLREAVARLAEEWDAAEDEADNYGPRAAYTGRDCAARCCETSLPRTPHRIEDA